MKLPVSFGSRLFYRVLLPGSFVSATIISLYQPIVSINDAALSVSMIFLAVSIAFGLIFLLLDRPIYMLIEGRRYWPALVWEFGVRQERRRLLRLHRTMRRHNRSRLSVRCSRRQAAGYDRRFYEAASQIADFPLHPITCMPSAAWPTRLGNLIAAYEQYPNIKYGLDAIFFWPRLWVSIDKDLRLELDGQQAQGDGAVYSSVACALSALILFFDQMWRFLSGRILDFSSELSLNNFLPLGVLVLGYLLYRSSIFSYQQFGELFMATFDAFQKLLDQSVAISILSEEYDLKLSEGTIRNRNRSIWRYLKWHRIRPQGKSKNIRAKTY